MMIIEVDQAGNVWLNSEETGYCVGRGVYETVEEAEADRDRLMNEPMYAEVEEYRQGVYGTISDMSKDVMGFRHRMDIRDLTTNELLEERAYWGRALEREIEEEQAFQEDDDISAALLAGAPDRETAVRWMAQA